MAEIIAASSRQKVGVRKSKKLSTRVDLTPMVDLGFLLITFFIFTATLSQPVSMKIYLPADGDPTKTPAEGALTILPLADDKVFFYHGDLSGAIQNNFFGLTDYDVKNGIGQVIRNKQLALDQSGKSRDDLMLIIKPSMGSSLKNSVDILDEVLINEIKRYAVTDMSSAEIKILSERNIEL